MYGASRTSPILYITSIHRDQNQTPKTRPERPVKPYARLSPTTSSRPKSLEKDDAAGPSW